LGKRIICWGLRHYGAEKNGQGSKLCCKKVSALPAWGGKWPPHRGRRVVSNSPDDGKTKDAPTWPRCERCQPRPRRNARQIDTGRGEIR